MNNKAILVIIVVIILLGGGYFLAKAGKQAATPTPTPTPAAMQEVTTTPTTTETTTMSPTPSGVTVSPMATKEITVEGTEFAFAPATITIKKDEPVTIIFKNNGQYPHNFTLVELNLQTKTIQPGQTDSITFTPAKAGTFTYKCTVDSHAEKGMTGTLTVE